MMDVTSQKASGANRPSFHSSNLQTSGLNVYRATRSSGGSWNLPDGGESGVDVLGQLEVLEGVKGNVPIVHDGKDDGDVSALEGQLLDGPQVWHRPLEAEEQRETVTSEHHRFDLV